LIVKNLIITHIFIYSTELYIIIVTAEYCISYMLVPGDSTRVHKGETGFQYFLLSAFLDQTNSVLGGNST